MEPKTKKIKNINCFYDKTKWSINETSIDEHYNIEREVIKMGMRSIIYKATNKTGKIKEYRAIKRILLNLYPKETKVENYKLKIPTMKEPLSLPESWKQYCIPQRVQKEILFHSIADNPNIVHLKEVYYSFENIILVMDYCEGGDLFNYWKQNFKNFTKYTLDIFELKVAGLFSQIMYALKFCHNFGIIHGDIRPSNILIVKKDESEEGIHLKISDFSFASEMDKSNEKQLGKSFYEFPKFRAPEILENKITDKIDIWSAGVILYYLLTGQNPFKIDTNKKPQRYSTDDIFKAIQFEKGWKYVSEEAKDLITKMVCEDSKRYNAEEVLKHEWFKKAKEQTLTHKRQKIVKFDINSFSSYVNLNGVIKTIWRYFAVLMNEEETKNIVKEFKEFDCKDHGYISMNEFKTKIKGHLERKISEKELKSLFEGIDTNSDERIEYREFLACAISRIPASQMYNILDRLRCTFNKFDLNGDGKITKEEFKKMLSSDDNDEAVEAEIEKFIQTYDFNKDGMIDFEEFRSIINMNQFKKEIK